MEDITESRLVCVCVCVCVKTDGTRMKQYPRTRKVVSIPEICMDAYMHAYVTLLLLIGHAMSSAAQRVTMIASATLQSLSRHSSSGDEQG